jgi:delta24(24(1))-sterol reductase
MSDEKLGFMLTFWNLAGVPLTYCHCTLALAVLTALYLFVYWVWDTSQCQKNYFRTQERGNAVTRNTFPQLPWRHVKTPVSIRTATGDSILCSGWCKPRFLGESSPAYVNCSLTIFVIFSLVGGMARKIHYTCDFFFAISWGLVTGFDSPFPWFFPVFFTIMILHRAQRDVRRCRERYGAAWEEYERRVPYLFIPVCLMVSLPKF